MGSISWVHWLIVIIWLVLIFWYLASTSRLLRAAGRPSYLVLLVLIPAIGAPIVQSIIAKRIGVR